MFRISFQNQKLKKWIHPNRRVGKPRMNWTEETIKEIWDHLRKDHPQDRFLAFNSENEYIINKIYEAAENDQIIKPEPKTRPRNNRTNNRNPQRPTNTRTNTAHTNTPPQTATPQTRWIQRENLNGAE